ncbi:hypothetical protein LLEC1_00826, partial [Akanthomyces lecanii]
MLASSLNGIYQQYKADTDVVAQWLEVTAKAHGYQSDNSSPASSNAATTGRLKGKARKQAKAAASGESSSAATTGPKAAHIIKIKDFEPMALHLASCSGIVIPSYFSRALDRVISVRKSFADRLASDGVDVSAKSNKSHSFFVEVLEKVKQALQPLLGTMRVYHTSAKFEKQPDAIPPPPTQTKHVAEQATSSMDLIFAVTALLDDYAHLRAEIHNLWTEHAAGRLDLAAVSVATNTALELAHSMEDDVVPLLEDANDPYNLDAYDIANVCYLNTLILVHSYAAGPVSCIDTIREYKWYDETRNGLAQSNRQKWTQDMTAVLELMPDLSFLISKFHDLSVVDELTRGLAYQLHRRSGTPLWLAFSVQVYLDILHNFGQICDGLGTMRAESRRIQYSMLDVPVVARQDVLRAAGLWDDDPIWAARRIIATTGVMPRVRYSPFTILRRNPMYCGLLIQNMRVTLQNTGLSYAAKPGALVSVVQLYHALRHEGLLANDCVWEDLQKLWTLQRDAAFFVVEMPKIGEAYFMNFSLSIYTQDQTLPPWSLDAVQEALSTGFAQRYADSRSQLRTEFKAKVDKAQALYAMLPPARLVREGAIPILHETLDLCFNLSTMHNEAWQFLERFHTAPSEQFSDVTCPMVYRGAQLLPFLPGLCFTVAAGQSLDRAQRMPASDAFLHSARRGDADISGQGPRQTDAERGGQRRQAARGAVAEARISP